MAINARREGDSILVDSVDVKRLARKLRSFTQDPTWQAPQDMDAALKLAARLLGFVSLHELNEAASKSSTPLVDPRRLTIDPASGRVGIPVSESNRIDVNTGRTSTHGAEHSPAAAEALPPGSPEDGRTRVNVMHAHKGEALEAVQARLHKNAVDIDALRAESLGSKQQKLAADPRPPIDVTKAFDPRFDGPRRRLIEALGGVDASNRGHDPRSLFNKTGKGMTNIAPMQPMTIPLELGHVPVASIPFPNSLPEHLDSTWRTRAVFALWSLLCDSQRDRGDIIAIVGAPGSGKSLLAKAVSAVTDAGLYDLSDARSFTHMTEGLRALNSGVKFSTTHTLYLKGLLTPETLALGAQVAAKAPSMAVLVVSPPFDLAQVVSAYAAASERPNAVVGVLNLDKMTMYRRVVRDLIANPSEPEPIAPPIARFESAAPVSATPTARRPKP